MEVKPGYKKTELLTGKRRLPGFSRNWETRRLGDIAQIKTGSRNNQDKIEEGEYPFFVRSATVERINTYSYDCEAILIPGEGGIGDIYHYVRGRFDVHQRVYAITQFSPEVSGRFIYFYMAEKFGTHAMQNSVKATVDSLRLPTFQNFEIMMPPTKAEQEAIAEALSDADAHIEALEQLIAKKRHLKQGAMQELLTGKMRLPGFSRKWEEIRFGEIVQPRKDRIDPRRGGNAQVCVELENIEQGTGRLVSYGAVEEGSSLKSVFQQDDVLFGKLRAYLKKYWLASCEGVCSTEFWVLAARPALLVPQYLFQLVTMDRFIEVASSAYGTHMPRSDWTVVKNYRVLLPLIEEQTAIAAILSDMDAQIAGLETELSKVRQIKQGMMQELLTGRTRLT